VSGDEIFSLWMLFWVLTGALFTSHVADKRVIKELFDGEDNTEDRLLRGMLRVMTGCIGGLVGLIVGGLLGGLLMIIF
jgi:hypothetical protein